MKKFTLLLATMLLVCVTSLWADKIATAESITSGKKYYIGATTGSTDYYLSVADAVSTSSVAGAAKADKKDATIFTFTQEDEGWVIQFENGNYLSLKDGRDNGKVCVVNTAATFTITTNTSKNLLHIACNNTTDKTYAIQKNNQGTQFGSYASTQTDVWLEEYVESASVSSIVIGGEPTKTEYIVGEKFNTDGLTVTASYSDGTKKEVTDETEWTIEPETLNLGTTSVNVTASFGGQETAKTYNISVREPNQYTITWMTMQGESTTTAIEGQPIAAPAAPTYAGKVFMGWSQNNTVATDGTDFTAVDFTTTTASANTTYYAVFATQEGGGEADTYAATLITSTNDIEDGGLYIIENDKHVAINTISNKALQTTTDYTIDGLTGTENYVWKLVAGTDGYYIESANDKNRLNNASTEMQLTTQGCAYTFSYANDIWKIVGNDNRFLGYTGASTYAYKAYASSNYNSSTYPHDIHLYKLTKEIATTYSDYVVAAYLEVEPAAIDFGELKDNENMSEKAEMVIALGHNLSEGITATLPEDAQFTIVSEPDGEGSLMVTVTPKPVIGTNEATLTFTSGICTATVALKAVIVKGTATALDNAAVAKKAVKMIENGQLVIIREGVKYNAQGAVIR